MNQIDFFGKLQIPKWQFDELQEDFKRATIRMAKLEMEYALLKAKYIELMDWIHRDKE